MASSSSSSSMLCPSCEREVIFIDDVFGCICSQCGLVLDDETELVGATTAAGSSSSSRPLHPSNLSTSSRTTNLGGTSSHWIQREARKAKSANDESLHDQSAPYYVTAVVSRILDHFGRANLQRETNDLFRQIKVISRAERDQYHQKQQQSLGSTSSSGARGERRKRKQEDVADGSKEREINSILDDGDEKDNDSTTMVKPKSLHGEEAEKKVAVAATFSVLKRHVESVALDEVCQVAAVASLSDIAESLGRIEALLGGTQLLDIARDDPSAYLSGHIGLLEAELASSESTLGGDPPMVEREEQKFIQSVNISSESFRTLADDSCGLCVQNGLHNRSAKVSARKDLCLCAWAILLLAMEASAGRVSREGKMADVMARLTHKGGAAEGDLVDASSSTSTSAELIKKRYMEISRMLSTYLEHLPWLSDQITDVEIDGDKGKGRKKANKAKGRKTVNTVKAELTSIKPMSRRIVAKYLTDVIKLQRFIEKKRGALNNTAEGWARYGSTEDFFHRIRASASGQREIKEEQERRASLGSSISSGEETTHTDKQSIFAAVDAILRAEGEARKGLLETSQLAQSIGHDLLKLDSLESMSGEVVDSLLFSEGEMDSYLRDETDMALLKQLRIDTGEWDRSSSPDDKLIRKRSRPAEEMDDHARLSKVTGKRTKALPEEEADRILSMMG